MSLKMTSVWDPPATRTIGEPNDDAKELLLRVPRRRRRVRLGVRASRTLALVSRRSPAVALPHWRNSISHRSTGSVRSIPEPIWNNVQDSKHSAVGDFRCCDSREPKSCYCLLCLLPDTIPTLSLFQSAGRSTKASRAWCITMHMFIMNQQLIL